jgi:hypothetical protein
LSAKRSLAWLEGRKTLSVYFDEGFAIFEVQRGRQYVIEGGAEQAHTTDRE